MKVLGLSASVIGVSTAWFLSKAGHSVTVIDEYRAWHARVDDGAGIGKALADLMDGREPEVDFKVL
jgi:glycine/D-amino acid oxidase-like deaminating enzyme